MARFTCVHPLILVTPPARFTPVEGEPELFEVESDDPAVVTALRGLGGAFGVTEDGAEPEPVEAAPVVELTPAEQESQPVEPVDDSHEPQE